MTKVFNKVMDTEPHDYVWTDELYPMSGTRLDSASGKLSYNYAEQGVDFASNSTIAVGDSIHITCQIPHQWLEGTVIRPHIHWKQNQSAIPAWKMSYRKYNNGDLVPSEWTTVVFNTHKFNYASNVLAQVSAIPEIDMTGHTISCFVEVRIHRIGAEDSYSGDALLTQFDIHYKVDSKGSRLEYDK